MLLEMKNIVKKYGSLTANKDVSLHLNKGEILAIAGENGAGKSTIMKILYGLEQASSGEIYMDGERKEFHSPSDAMACGIGMVQQHFMLFSDMTVAENIVYSREIRRGIFIDEKRLYETINNLSKQYKLFIDPKSVVKECSVGLQQRVEILKVLYQNAEIIIFDEPSAVLTPLEVDELLKTMKALAAGGKSLIIITHKLNEVMEVADRIVVMRMGEVAAERKKEKTSIEELSYLMVGRQVVSNQIKPHESAQTVLDVKDLSLYGENKKVLDHINIQVSEGEIVGIAGVSGNGQTELIRCLSGLQHSDEGRIFLSAKDVTNKSVQEIRNAGMAHIPEDRYAWGSALEATLYDNALIGFEEKCSRKGFFSMKKVYEHGADLIEGYNVKVGSVFQKMKELSGGNAQKLIVAREISKNTKFLIACEPTRGIDIGAIEYIHGELVKKRDKGDGILLVSSELSEILALSDRIYVIFEGKIRGEFSRKEFIEGTMDDRKLGLVMTGGKLSEYKR